MDNSATAEGSAVFSTPDTISTAVNYPNDDEKLPIYVTFRDGSPRILVLMSKTARVQDLQLEVLKRKGQPYSHPSLPDAIIQTTGASASEVDSQDVLSELIRHTENNTFSFGVANAKGGTLDPQYAKIQRVLKHLKLHRGHGNTQGVRWIDVEAALVSTKLDHIAVDEASFDPHMTLEDFYAAAVVRLKADEASLKLWSKYGPLDPVGNKTTIGDLGLSSFGETLDVFFQVYGPKDRHSLPSGGPALDFDPKARLDIETTRRGLCTFISHTFPTYPPRVRFVGIYNTDIIDTSNRANIQLLAHVFDNLCKLMVPEWICASGESKLEGCRQVTAWIYQLCLDTKDKADKTPQHVHQIHVFQPPEGENENATALSVFGNADLVIISQNDQSVPEVKFAVSLETPSYGLGKKLALAASFHRDLRKSYHYYFMPEDGWPSFIRSSRLRRPDVTDFDGLLTSANVYPTFRMVDPMKLGVCLSAELPVITLSGRGFVSLYAQEDIECSERGFYLWNVIEGKHEANMNNPSQEISQVLEAIITERKGAQSWEIDAWTNWSATANHGPPEESLVICVDTSGSMSIPMPHGWNNAFDTKGQRTSRLHQVKDFFSHFSTRLSSYGLSTHIGLVTFDNFVQIGQPLAAIQLDFRHKLDSIEAGNGTAIFSALITAGEMLIQQKQVFPETKCRIVLLTDGENNWPGCPRQVCEKLYKNDIVLDTIIIGSNQTRDLFKIVRSTGGYAFRPSTQDVFFQIFLLETMVDIRTRPDIVMEKPADWGYSWSVWEPKTADMKDQYSFPPCRPHPSENDSFMSVEDANRYSNKKRSSTGGIAFSASGLSDSYSTLSGRQSTCSMTPFASRFLMNEVRQMIENVHPDMDVYVSLRNMGFWKVVIQGPKASAYEDGTFLLFVDIGPEFPRLPPAVRFITPILHPNISKHGRVCHPIFDREWSPNMHIFTVLQHIYGIFMNLEARDAIDPIAAFKFYTDPAAGMEQVKAYVAHFATSRTRDNYRNEIVGTNPAPNPSSGSRSNMATYDDGSVTSSDIVWPRAQSLLRHAILGSRVRPPPFMDGGSSGQLTFSNLARIKEESSDSTPEEDGGIGGRRVRTRRDDAYLE